MASDCLLLNLPPEILRCILLNCGWRELVQLSATCHQLHYSVQDDTLWRHLAYTEYHVAEVTGLAINTFKKLYQRLLHPYGWMIGLYWSRIDYFGGLLEIQVSGDSLVATSLQVTIEGVLEGIPSFEVCAATRPASQLCSMIERTHVTAITQCKDRESLRQKCQFHDTKFAQGHYNYNTLEGFRAMTFIDAHRLGIMHHPLTVPTLSSIPRELWTTAPPNALTRTSHGSSPNFFEGAAASRRNLDPADYDQSKLPMQNEDTAATRANEARQKLDTGSVWRHHPKDTGSSSAVSRRTTGRGRSVSNHRHKPTDNGNNYPREDSVRSGIRSLRSTSCTNSPNRTVPSSIDQSHEILFRLVAQCGNGRQNISNVTPVADIDDPDSTNKSDGVATNLNCTTDDLSSKSNGSEDCTESESMEVSREFPPDIFNGTSNNVTDNFKGVRNNSTSSSISNDSLSACNNASSSSTNDSLSIATSSDSTDNFFSNSMHKTAACVSSKRSSTRDLHGNSSSRGHGSTSTNGERGGFSPPNIREQSSHGNNYNTTGIGVGSSIFPANAIGNSRQELAQLYRETYCNPFSDVPDDVLPAPSSGGGLRRYDLPRSRFNEEPPTSHHSRGASSSSLSSLPPLPLCVEPTELPPHVLKPGLYSAHYGPHGYEIILLEYKIREISLLKILGDQFVPTREVTVKICLPFSFQLTAEQQRTMTCSDLIKMEPESCKLPLSYHLQQPFVLPPFCSPGVETDIPPTCWARYHGFGQLANLFHSQPKFSRVHVIVFSNEKFGVIFLQLKTFMIFRRINREFPKRPNIRRASANAND